MARWRLGLGLWLAGTSLQAEALTLATYNLANYNLTNRQIEGAFLASYPKPEAEKTALRRVLHDIDADILALQEIGGQEFLRELQRDLRREGLDYPEAVVLDAVDTQRKVGVLSRRPLTHIGRHTDLNFKYFSGREFVKRGMLEVRFDTRAGEVTLFVVHLKSRLTERRDDPGAALRRGREATAARDRVLSIFPEPQRSRFIIAGDFNEGPMHRPVRAFSRIAERPISYLLPAADSRGETWTHRYRRNDEYARVDFVMVSAPLISWVRDGAGVVRDDPTVLRASDHRPVVVTFDVPARGALPE
jgi:endonuclease/exonuclease/phosphatase family metal-dependent hydrolase